MQPLAFTLSALVLLATPGPTNTLLWLSGAAVGFRRSAQLLLGELGGYLAVIIPAVALLAPFLAAHPQIGLALRIVAAFWVLFLAYALWTTGDDNRASPEITTQRVFVTTLLNPKALIVALVLLPQTGLVATIPWITGFSLLVVVAGSFWIGAGAMLIRLSRGAHMSNLPRRIAAVCLAVFSFGIAGSALATML
ncbi:threonine transporter RhtB [Ensifer sp. T173]|uniref:Threonine transporter RhtB n=2 Tax=Sinorhizobium/Ensifer group TaxID=227292 RepID=A0AAW4FDG1_9HYPH|nr:threonine transporter RhtB [Ensifer sp. Root31]KQW63385.1 threonine transporter RhtB [Ensifer sp. Root1252]KQW85458.1 threonine transporter RhtB [Ensifer sp. Root127]KQY71824.1 threonine transporter RhtB [Ensifer sp. Root142]KRC84253.1 threonine transporter RhtB [Ensifer sp. Root231]KRD04540.1 threonine transporter RhtB [Ensifer sp. Root258]MBD9486060.1 threonine transporter RhtB [Ensifer sp. ENS11]MBM3090195.1 threonine transporter RhtB [Ensifer canadensis]OMQ43159.1 threonine transport